MSVSTKDPSSSGVDVDRGGFASEAGVQRIIEALAVAATGLVRSRNEQEVFEAAVETIFKLGFYTTLLRLDGTRLGIAAMRQDPVMLARGSELYGIPAGEVVFDATRVPHLDRMWRTRRAVYYADALDVMREVHLPEVVEMMRETLPPMRMMDAPIFVDDVAWGFFSVQGENLTPAVAAALELFAQLLGGALENVRHHDRAKARVRELEHLQRELVSHARLAAVGEAAGVLSHEARNPLGAIFNSLAVLRRHPGIGGDGREVLDIAEEEAQKLDALVRDLLELARPLEPRVRDVALQPLVVEATGELNRRLRGVADIRINAEGDVPPIEGDPSLLRLVIENLIRNAIQAGGGAAAVEVVLRDSGSSVELSVTDAGPVRPSPVADPEDPFALARSRGTGLGLAVVKRAVEAQGAHLRVSGDGRTLTVVARTAKRR